MAHEKSRRVQDLFLGLGMKDQFLGEARMFRLPLVCRCNNELIESCDDLLVLGQHAGQLGLKLVGKCQHASCLWPYGSLRQSCKQAKRRQGKFFLADKMWVQSLRYLFGRFTNAATCIYSAAQFCMELLMFGIERFGD